VHIDDPEFYDRFYSSREALQKPQHLKWRFFSPNALFSTPEHHLHRLRRSSQESFFAKGRIHRLAPQIQILADRMCRRLKSDFSCQLKPVCLNDMFTSFVGDVTTQYSFDCDFRYLDDPNFLSPFTKEIKSFLVMVHPCTQFPLLARLLYTLPDSLVHLVLPATQGLQEFQDAMNTTIRQAKKEVLAETCDPNKTVMHGILSSKLPLSEKRDEVLIDQATGLVAAGIVSTRWTLTLACYHIISDQRIWTTLRRELEEANPDSSQPLTLLELEQMPYLTACVEEGTFFLFQPIEHVAKKQPSHSSSMWTNHTLSSHFAPSHDVRKLYHTPRYFNIDGHMAHAS
jgi:cytochrome P450